MRHLPIKTNRAWLFVLGLLLLLAGLAGTLVAAGVLARLGSMVGLDLSRPSGEDTVLSDGVASQLETTVVVVAVVVGGLLLALAGLSWLIRQIPHRGLAKPFRLHDDPDTGLTRVAPDVLTDAVEQQVRTLSGVSKASAQLRGSARAPELTLRVTTDERTDLATVLAQIQTEVVHDLQTTLDTAVTRLAVLVEIDPDRASVSQITR